MTVSDSAKQSTWVGDGLRQERVAVINSRLLNDLTKKTNCLGARFEAFGTVSITIPTIERTG